jgi:PAS domain S-box-containing protein
VTDGRETIRDPYPFLKGGGEMGEAIRQYDWSNSILGPIEKWPRSLVTTLGVILHSAFPMFFFWGKELICFYNDPFRPSLGVDGKHPAIGKFGKQVWPEIWDFIGPLIDNVMTKGENVRFDDQLVPFYRNGRIEDIYWTFSYSPAYGDDGTINGVVVTCMETTEKVNSFRQLRENKDFLHFATEATELAIWDYDTLTQTFTGNERLKEWFGFTPEAVIDPSKLIAVIAENERERVGESIRKALQFDAGGRYEMVYTLVHPSTKKERIVNSKGRAWFNEDKKAYRYHGTLQDITSSRRAQEALQRNEQRFRNLIAESMVPTALFRGRNLVLELANDSMLQFWEKDASVIGKTILEFFPDLAGNAFLDVLDQVYTTGVTYSAQDALAFSKGKGGLEKKYVDFTYKAIRDEEGNISGILAMATDVTERFLARAQLLQSERNLRNTILKAPVAMCIFKGRRHIVEIANDRMIELWGTTAEQVMYKPIFEGLPEAKDQGFEQLLDTVFDSGEAYAAQGIPIKLPRGGKTETVYVNFVYEAFRESDGSISGVIAVATDVTEQVLARQKIEEVVAARTSELAQANEKLQKSNAELAQFAYIASHDLQEPVRKVATFAQMLENRLGPIDELSRSYLDRINSSTVRMLALIRDVLSYSELSGDRETFEPVDLQKIIAGLKTDFELLIEQKSAIIDCVDLPIIEAIPLQMSQLFRNLLSNALKFAAKDSPPRITIRSTSWSLATPLSASAPGDTNSGGDHYAQYYKIDVADNGIGFKQIHADQIFSIFQRLHVKSEYPGTGIGLAMCKKIAQNHHGDIYATASPGSGAVFTVLLPAKQANTT